MAVLCEPKADCASIPSVVRFVLALTGNLDVSYKYGGLIDLRTRRAVGCMKKGGRKGEGVPPMILTDNGNSSQVTMHHLAISVYAPAENQIITYSRTASV